jgi:uncharacterized membrane protein YphA (DoxX/SURF4 family)
MKARFWIALLLRLFLGFAFVWAAMLKLRDPLAFATAVESYQVVSAGWARWVALGLPWLELWAGLGVFFPGLRRASVWIVGMLLLGFIGLHLSAWWRGLEVDCGCFGSSGPATAYTILLVRNSLLLLGAAILIYWNRERELEERGMP